MSHVDNNNTYIKIRSKPKYFIFLCIYYFLYPICHLLYGRRNNWLLCERGDDAQDNGFVFFKYLREHHLEVNPVYLIKKSSPDYQKVSSLGKVVEFGSIKHFLMMIGTPTKISSHLFGYSPWVQSTLYYRRHKTRHNHILLQHGITKNDIPGFYYEVCKSLDVFVCGAKPEYEYIRGNFGYSDGVVQYTGFPRFDNLLDKSNNRYEMLIMPTWRRYLSDLSDEQFINTDYYHNWNGLINNKELIDVCNDKNITIKFFIHYSLKNYLHLFKSESQHIKFIKAGEEDVQTLLKESIFLITDFSSVYFDFAYMNKPMVFFQFDEDKYNKEHYAKGYFDYRIDGFGDVCKSIEDTLKSIIDVFNNNFKINDKYNDRATRFFTLENGHNCDRVYESIIRIK